MSHSQDNHIWVITANTTKKDLPQWLMQIHIQEHQTSLCSQWVQEVVSKIPAKEPLIIGPK